MFEQIVNSVIDFKMPTAKNVRTLSSWQYRGEDHHRAKLSDREVEMIRDLREGGWAYKALADKFGANKHYIGKICRYERR